MRGDSQVEVDRVSPLESGTPGSISFLASAKHKSRLQACRASVLIVSDPSLLGPESGAHSFLAVLVVADAYVAYAQATALLHPATTEQAGIHPSAFIHPTATVSASVSYTHLTLPTNREV